MPKVSRSLAGSIKQSSQTDRIASTESRPGAVRSVGVSGRGEVRTQNLEFRAAITAPGSAFLREAAAGTRLSTLSSRMGQADREPAYAHRHRPQSRSRNDRSDPVPLKNVGRIASLKGAGISPGEGDDGRRFGWKTDARSLGPGSLSASGKAAGERVRESGNGPASGKAAAKL